MLLKRSKTLEKGEINGQLNVLMQLFDGCFVCDDCIQDTSANLVWGQTLCSNATFSTKIGEVVRNEALVVCLQDVRCANLFHLLNKLETEWKESQKEFDWLFAKKIYDAKQRSFSKFDKPEDVSEEFRPCLLCIKVGT